MVLVSYDLKSDVADYAALYQEMQNIGGGVDGALRILESTWVLATNLNPNQVSERLQQVIKQGDRFIVVNLNGFANRQGWLAKEMWTWIIGHDNTNPTPVA